MVDQSRSFGRIALHRACVFLVAAAHRSCKETLIDRVETFCLRFKFSKTYPIDAPEVTFLNSAGYKPPIHPHIYSNGHLCLSILSETSSSGWSPVLNGLSNFFVLQFRANRTFPQWPRSACE